MSRSLCVYAVCALAAACSVVCTDQPWKEGAALYEDFSTGWEDRWKHTDNAKYAGKFESVKPQGWQDSGIKMPDKSQHYGLYTQLTSPVDPSEGLVVQYEVKYAEGVTCGGAYLKLVTDSVDLKETPLDSDTPYTLMFGPDKCGSSSKVHVIFRHRNPKTGTITEKHLKNPPSALTDEATHVYTLKVAKDNKFEVLIDGESKASGSLLADFTPAFSTPAEIPDPEDKKPDTWVDEPKIKDPEATKPEDWVEESQIDDPKARKPAGWLEDEPAVVPDPAAKQPDDWDVEEDGDWTPPEVPNPACKKAGCGPWTAPKINNPDYKGPWAAPLIDNPEFKGPWVQKVIPNTEHYEESEPLKNVGKIQAAAFELWTIDSGYTFANVLISSDLGSAEKLRATVWKPKAAAEKKFLKKSDDEEEDEGGLGKWLTSVFDREPLSKYKYHVQPALDFIEEKEWAAWAVVVTPLVLLVLSLMVCLLASGPKPAPQAPVDAVGARKKEDITEEDDDEPADEDEAEEMDDGPAVPEPSGMTTRTAAKSYQTGEIVDADDVDDDDAKGPTRRRRA